MVLSLVSRRWLGRRRSRNRVNTRGGWGDSIMRCVIRMPTMSSAGSRWAERAVAAVPAKTPRRRPEIRAACDHGAAQAPARAVAEEQLGALLLRRRELVGHHQLDGRPRQDALAAMPPLVQQHALEGEIVVDRRDQARRRRLRRPAACSSGCCGRRRRRRASSCPSGRSCSCWPAARACRPAPGSRCRACRAARTGDPA